MTLEISDGFNFAMGEWLAEMSIFLVSCAALLMISGVVYGGFCLYEWLCERKARK